MNWTLLVAGLLLALASPAEAGVGGGFAITAPGLLVTFVSLVVVVLVVRMLMNRPK